MDSDESLLESLRDLINEVIEDIEACKRMMNYPSTTQADRSFFNGCIHTDMRRLETLKALLDE